MSTQVLVGTYQYTYGAGNTPNRELQFYGDGKKIWGEVQAKSNGSWKKIGKVEESNMTLEGASTTQKMKIMMEAREKNISPQYPEDRRFSGIPYENRVGVIENLQPTGPYRITITNNIADNPYFEKVERLTFFDPS